MKAQSRFVNNSVQKVDICDKEQNDRSAEPTIMTVISKQWRI